MPFNGFTDEFTNSPIQSTYPSYLALNFTGLTSIQLEWVFQNQNTIYPFSNIMNVTTNTVATNAVLLPDASVTSVGQTASIVNTSSTTILVKNYSGTLVATITASQAWDITLTDNSTTGGSWIALQLGSTTSSATAASLIDPSVDANSHSNAGGLKAFATNYLKSNQLVFTFTSGSSYTQNTGDRGNVLIWQAGSGNYNCLAAATSGNGFVFTIDNNSQTGGVITVVPDGSDTINGSALPFTLNPGDSSCFVSDGTSKIYSFSSSRTTTSVTNLVNIDLTNEVSNVITLSTLESAYSIQKCIGTVGSGPYPNITIEYPVNKVAEYVAFNASTTNSIIVQVDGEADSNYKFTISPGNRLFLFSDGTHLYNVPNVFTNVDISFLDGTAAAPSIDFSNDVTTGVFRSQVAGYVDALGITQDGVASMYFFSSANGNNTSINTLNTSGGTYKEEAVSIYSLMRAYG